MRVTSTLLSGLLFLVVTHSAPAQTDLERATARDAASSGVSAFQAGHYEQAIDSFSRAEQLVHSPTHLLFLARAQAKVGKLVAAHENYLKVVREALPAGAPKAFADAQAAAEAERGAVDARLPSVTIAVQGSAPADVTVEMDGTKLPAAMIGIPLPVDPGQHVFLAKAPSAESEPVSVTMTESGKQTVLLTLVRKAEARPSDGPISTAPNASPASDRATKEGHALRTAAIVSFGAGAVGLGLGTVFLLQSGSTRKSSNGLYDSCLAKSTTGKCTDPALQDPIVAKDAEADGQRNRGAAALIVGGIGAASGVTLLLLDNRREHSSARATTAQLTPILGFGSVGVIGTF